MTGVFYSNSKYIFLSLSIISPLRLLEFPSDSSTTGTLAGMGVCALAFYLGLQLLLIGLWHQKYRQENPKKIVGKSSKHNDSSAHLKTSMEENEPYDYSYQQPMDYTSYGDYSNPGYVSNVSEEMLLQQPGAATGAVQYEPVTWLSNVQVETQPDPKFLQPMDWAYGPQPIVESPSTTLGFTAPVNETNTIDNTRIVKFVYT